MLHKLKLEHIKARFSRDYQARYDVLVEYYCELAGQMNESKDSSALIEKHDGLMSECKTALNEIRKAKLSKFHAIDGKYLDVFDKWLFELKRLQQHLGIGMPQKKDPRFAMASGR